MENISCPQCGEADNLERLSEHEVECGECGKRFEPNPDDFVGDHADEDFIHDGDMDDSMDGDFDSGMASAGFGTDEDYGGGCERL